MDQHGIESGETAQKIEVRAANCESWLLSVLPLDWGTDDSEEQETDGSNESRSEAVEKLRSLRWWMAPLFLQTTERAAVYARMRAS